MTSSALRATAVLLAGSLLVQCGSGRGPSTAEERARVVELARSLEQEPFAADAAETRRWLRAWAIEVPDIPVRYCAELLGHGLGDDYPYLIEVNEQAIFSAGAFAIEHPNEARDEMAQYTAGVEGALRVYAVLLESRSDARSPFLDELSRDRDRGELVDSVARLANQHCPRAHTQWLAALGGAGVALLLALLVVPRWGREHAVAGPGDPARRARRALVRERAVLACVAYYLLAGAALHVLEPEFDPRFRFMSEYVWGRYGWLMTTTFFVLGLATLVVAAGLRRSHARSRDARLGSALLVVGGSFVCLAGVFKDFLPHVLASAVAIPSLVMATLLLSLGFGRAGALRSIQPVALGVALGMFIAFLANLLAVGLPGLQQRAFLVLFLAWLAVVARQLARISRPAG